jgi:hypothetical protein
MGKMRSFIKSMEKEVNGDTSKRNKCVIPEVC